MRPEAARGCGVLALGAAGAESATGGLVVVDVDAPAVGVESPEGGGLEAPGVTWPAPLRIVAAMGDDAGVGAAAAGPAKASEVPIERARDKATSGTDRIRCWFDLMVWRPPWAGDDESASAARQSGTIRPIASRRTEPKPWRQG